LLFEYWRSEIFEKLVVNKWSKWAILYDVYFLSRYFSLSLSLPLFFALYRRTYLFFAVEYVDTKNNIRESYIDIRLWRTKNEKKRMIYQYSLWQAQPSVEKNMFFFSFWWKKKHIFVVTISHVYIVQSKIEFVYITKYMTICRNQWYHTV
jgi:hypothetical protein